MGGRSAEALAKRAEKRGRTVEEEEVKEKEAREKKRKETKPEKPQEPERPAAAAVARRPAAGDPARLPTSQRHDNGLWQRQRELNGKLAHGSRQEIFDLVAAHVHELNSVNVATALHRLAKCAPAATVGLGQTDARWKKAWAAAVSSAVEPAPDQQEVRLAALCGRAAAVLHEERGVTSRSLTSIAWAVGKLKLAHAGLLAALTEQAGAQLKRGALDAFGVANVAWALATLREAHEADASLLDALAEAAIAPGMPAQFKPQELTNMVWAFATLKRRHNALFEALAATATQRADEFTPQGLSQTVWAYSKLGLSKHTLLLAAAAAAGPRAPRFDAQSIATMAWAFANLEVEHGPLLSALSREAVARPEAFDSSSCAQLLWALSRLSDGVDPKAVDAMARRVGVLASGGLQSQQLLYSLGALAKLPAGKEASLPSVLCRAAAAAAPTLTANKLGIAAWALARPAVRRRLEPQAARAWRGALRARCAEPEVVEHLNWRTIGHIEMGLRALGDPVKEADPLVATLTAAAAASVVAANERSAALNAAPAALLAERAPWAALALPKQSHLLLVGFDPSEALDAALQQHGMRVTHWRRFATAAADGSAAAWPPTAASDGAPFAACAVRWPWYAAGDAAAMLMHAAASSLPGGAPLWLCGNADEGAEGAPAALACAGFAGVRSIEQRGATLYEARREGAAAAAGARGSLAAWRTEGRLQLPAAAVGAPSEPSVPWVTYPGLFAGGGLDVMTAALLRALPTPPAEGTVLDACCGSGVIGAALRARGGAALDIHLLDADAVALDAARANVPSAARSFLCGGWPDTATAFPKKGKPKKYDWIVSNPPVHHGQPDDFSVVVELISGARSRLTKSGVLWLVAQEQVPMGRMLAAYGDFAWVDAAVSDDGRFVTWSAGRSAKAGGGGGAAAGGAAAGGEDEGVGGAEAGAEAVAEAAEAEAGGEGGAGALGVEPKAAKKRGGRSEASEAARRAKRGGGDEPSSAPEPSKAAAEAEEEGEGAEAVGAEAGGEAGAAAGGAKPGGPSKRSLVRDVKLQKRQRREAAAGAEGAGGAGSAGGAGAEGAGARGATEASKPKAETSKGKRRVNSKARRRLAAKEEAAKAS